MAPDERSGAVEGFDEAVGLGTVRGDDGCSFPFHCTAIADKSRRIDVGAVVTFSVRPGHAGTWEAVGVTPRPAAGSVAAPAAAPA